MRPTTPDSSNRVPQEGSKILGERERIARLSRVRELVFGSLDGLIVPLGVISGVAGGTGSSQAVIVAGIAEAFAGALSMGAGEFISARAEAQVQKNEIQREIDEMATTPEYEKRELAQIYQLDGMSPEDANLVVETMARYPRAYQTAMGQRARHCHTRARHCQDPPSADDLSFLSGWLVLPAYRVLFLPISEALPVSLC